MNYKRLCAAILLALFMASCHGNTKSKIEMQLGNRLFRLEIARTPAQREKGLMFRKFMAKDSGMIFIFDEDAIRGFWMKNTNLPLSIAYISAEGKVLEIYDMQPHSLASVVSRRPFRYAIEVNQGEFEKVGLDIGDTLDFSSIN